MTLDVSISEPCGSQQLTLSDLTEATFPGGTAGEKAAWRNRLRVLGIRGAITPVAGGGKSGFHRRYDGLSVIIAKAVCTLLDTYQVHTDIAVKIGHHIRAHRHELDCGDPVLVLGDWSEADGSQSSSFIIGCRDYILEQISERRFRHVLILQLEEPEGEGGLT